MRMTKSRKLIYDILEGSAMPLSAKEIYDQVKNQGNEIWLSTIYRALEVFEDKNLVIKAQLPGSDEHHYILCNDSHHHYAICLSCKKIIENIQCPMNEYEPMLNDQGFKVVDHKFIIYGYCEECKGGSNEYL